MPRIMLRISAASVLLMVVIVLSTLGFYLVGGGESSFIDALYMALITISTVGYNEIVPLDSATDRIFGGVASMIGFGALTFLFTSLSVFFLEQDLDQTLRRRRMEKQIRKLRDHYLVCGFGRVGRSAAQELLLSGRKFVAIDPLQSHFDDHRDQFPDLLYLQGDASDDALLLAADIRDAAGVFAVTGDDSRNLMITITARHLNPTVRVVARAEETRNIEKMRKAGANEVIAPDFTGGLRIASAMIRPQVVNFLDEMRHTDSNFRVDELSVPAAFAPTRLGSLQLSGPEFVLLAVRRGDEWVFNPGCDFLLEAGHVLVAMSSTAGRLSMQAFLQRTVRPGTASQD